MSSISPRYAKSHVFGTGPHTIDVYLDYVCPYCTKIFKFLRSVVFPLVTEKFPGQFKFVFRHQIQPWHPSSTLTAEAAIVVGLLAPEKFFDFSDILFDRANEYYDGPTYHEARADTYKRLAKLAHESVGVDEAEFLNLIEIKVHPGSNNAGSLLDKDVKYFVRSSRQNGVHVSPTIAINGIIDLSFESSTPAETWIKKLGDIIAAANVKL